MEERMKRKDVLLIFCLIGLIMIIIAGSRAPEDTPDSDNYEYSYNSITSLQSGDLLQEPSFIYISYFLNSFGFGVNALFFTYAFMSIPIRLTAIWKMSKLPLLTLGIYISFYYQLHDLVQIRCAVASALFLLAVYYRIEKRNMLTLLCILIGTIFHYSALAGLVIFLFNNKEINIWWYAILYLVVPLGMIIYLSGFDISYLLPEQLGGDRLEAYRAMKEWGKEGDLEGVTVYKNPMILTNMFLYYLCIWYNKVLSEYCKYIPLLLKIMAVAFFCRLMLDNISSVLASRLFEYFDVVSIFLWTAVIYSFYPIYIGKVFTHTVSSARLFYSMLIYTLQL